MRIGDDEADIRGDRSDVGNMIANSFELQKDRAHDPCPQRKFHLSGAFNGLAESCSMGKTRIPGDAFRKEHGLVYGQFFEEFFRALVGIEHAKLQIKDGLTCHSEIKMTGLDGSGMNRAHWHLKDAFTQSRPIDVALSLEGREHGLESEVLAQGMNIWPVVVQGDPARIGVSDSF